MSDVHVRNKDGLFSKCKPLKNGTWKCGFCLRGLINPIKGYQCKVCKCRVSQVVAFSIGPFGIQSPRSP